MAPIIKRLAPYRDLLLVFIWREFSVRYRQSIIGAAWAVFQPLAMMAMFTFIFTYVMPAKVSEQPYVIFFYAGILPWSLFETSIKYSVPSLTNHFNLITKIYFPKEILPFSGVCVAFIDFCISLIVFFLLMAFFGVHVSYYALWFFPLLVLHLLFTVSVAMCLAALNVYYRDVGLATGFLIQMWFFATPVFYSIDKLPLKIKLVLFLNPMTFIVENMRRCLIEQRGVVFWQYVLLGVFVCFLFLISYRFFIRMERRFADVI